MSGTVVAILVAVAGSLLLLWLVLLACLAVVRPEGSSLRECARIVPDVGRLVTRLSRDRTLSRGVRLRLVLLVGYLAMPIDLVPDFIPVLGYADDVIVIGVVLRGVIRRAGADLVRAHWSGTDTGLQVLGRLCRIPELDTARPA